MRLRLASVAVLAVMTGCAHRYGAAIGLQLAIRTNRLSALVMGGFPPLDGPYAEMLQVTTAAHQMAVETEQSPQPAEAPEVGDWSSVSVSMSDAQTRQFVTLYRALQDFDDRAAQSRITCPRLCFVGSVDEMQYGEKWGNVHIGLAGPIVQRRAELNELGWEVRVLDGLDHMQAMQATQVLPVLRPWLMSQLVPESDG